jgi:hypothetical protein
MKTCLVVSDLPVVYKVESFSNQNLQVIHDMWPDIKQAIERALRLVNSFGIDRDNLTSANALIPIAYYLRQNHDVKFLGGSTAFDVKNAARMRRWLTLALLNNVFGASSDNALRGARNILVESGTAAMGGKFDFPADGIDAELAKSGRASYSSQQAIDNFLGIRYGEKHAYLALTLLYDDNHWGGDQGQQDHIFPRALFTADNMRKAGLDAETQARYLELVNTVANLEVLLPAENTSKSDKDFATWLASRDEKFRQRHLIPDDPSLLAFDRFEEFIESRAILIQTRIEKLFA